jgi:hypothetical protein
MQTKKSIPLNKNIKKKDGKILIKNYVNSSVGGEKAKLLLLLPFVRSLLLSSHTGGVGLLLFSLAFALLVLPFVPLAFASKNCEQKEGQILSLRRIAFASKNCEQKVGQKQSYGGTEEKIKTKDKSKRDKEKRLII